MDVLCFSGLMAAALAKNHGCYVASTSRSAKSRDLILSSGAEKFILDDGKIASTLKRPSDKFDKVLELVGITTLKDSLQCCTGGNERDKPLGVVTMTGIAGGSWTMDGFYPMMDVPMGVSFTTYSGGGDEMRKTPFEQIVKDVEEGRLKVPVGKTLKLDEVVEAHRMMEHGGAGGKMVLLM